jgi:hypothetical protein
LLIGSGEQNDVCHKKPPLKEVILQRGNRRAGLPVNKNHKLAAGVAFVPALDVTAPCQNIGSMNFMVPDVVAFTAYSLEVPKGNCQESHTRPRHKSGLV